MEMVSPGVNGHLPPATSAASIIDPGLIVEYLTDLLEITLGASSKDLESSGSLLSDSKKQDTVQRCTRFASESQVVLYVQKNDVAAVQPNGVNGSTGSTYRTSCGDSVLS